MAAITFTGRQLITRSLQAIGVIAAGEVPSASDMADSKAILNGMIDGWQTQRLTLAATTGEEFPFTNNQSTYEIGPTAADWVTTRPVVVDAITVLAYTATLPYEIPIVPLDEQSYIGVTQKTQTATFPQNWYLDGNAPNASIFFWPTPTDSANYKAVVYAPAQLDTVGNISTSITMAPGYYRALYYNLAVELALPFAVAIPPQVQYFADKSLNDIKRINLQPMDLMAGAPLPGTGGIYNILGDFNY